MRCEHKKKNGKTIPISCVSKRIFNKKIMKNKNAVSRVHVCYRAFIFITAQKRLQYIASVATLQRIEERLIFSRVRSKSTNHFFSVLAGTLTKIK